MTRQEVIREGIAEKIFEWCKRNGYIVASFEWKEVTGATRGMILAITDILLEYEDSQGVVLKVDKELPEPITHWDAELTMGQISFLTMLLMESEGYKATESLVEG